MEKTCYNPYHFVPVSKRTTAQKAHDLERDKLATDFAGATTHERYVPGTHSGRLVCKVTTVTPLVVGAKQSRQGGQVGRVEPYLVAGRPAIPGSSLRGMVGSLVEAASNSAARVLGGDAYSYRKPFQSATKPPLSAIGLIVRKDGKLMLRPLTLPTLTAVNRGGVKYFEVPREFRAIFPKKPAFKVYLGDDVRVDSGKRTFRAEGAWTTVQSMEIPELAYEGSFFVRDHDSLHCKGSHAEPRKFAVSQTVTAGAKAKPGMFRILGCWTAERKKEIPHGKKHELWLPQPGPEVESIAIDPKAIERFHALADERTAEKGSLPFHPMDTRRNEDPATLGDRFRLKIGDLVYFDVKEIDKQIVVTEISLSAIWRGRVETKTGKPARPVEFFEAVDPELIPFGPRRKKITIAERMLGFVEELEKADDEREQGGMALASRIRFSDGTLGAGVTKEQALEPSPVVLRILSSPKTPSPALYFKGALGGRFIPKVDLKPGEHHPQGRKVYLHHSVRQGTKPWETQQPGESREQKNQVQPVRVGQDFSFHVDFENLTDGEMGLLLYALAPEAKFHHKLGMGKPLGLGSVKVAVVEWQAVDRQKRYSVMGLRAARAAVRLPEESGFWALRDQAIASGLVGAEMHKALCILGDFAGAPPAGSIHTPTLDDQVGSETETYKWFVANEGGLVDRGMEIRAQNQFLKPLAESVGRLPEVKRPEWRVKERKGGW